MSQITPVSIDVEEASKKKLVRKKPTFSLAQISIMAVAISFAIMIGHITITKRNLNSEIEAGLLREETAEQKISNCEDMLEKLEESKVGMQREFNKTHGSHLREIDRILEESRKTGNSRKKYYDETKNLRAQLEKHDVDEAQKIADIKSELLSKQAKLNEEISFQKSSLKNYEATINSLKNSFSQRVQDIKDQNADLTEKKEKLENEIEAHMISSQNRIQELTSQLNQTTFELAKISEDNRNLTAQVHKLENDNAKLSETNKIVTNVNLNLNSNNLELKIEVEKLVNENEMLHKNFTELFQKYKELNESTTITGTTTAPNTLFNFDIPPVDTRNLADNLRSRVPKKNIFWASDDQDVQYKGDNFDDVTINLIQP